LLLVNQKYAFVQQALSKELTRCIRETLTEEPDIALLKKRALEFDKSAIARQYLEEIGLA